MILHKDKVIAILTCCLLISNTQAADQGYNQQFPNSVQQQGNYLYGPGGSISNTPNMNQSQQQKYILPPRQQTVDMHNIFQNQQPNRLNQQQQTVDTKSVSQWSNMSYNANTNNSVASQPRYLFNPSSQTVDTHSTFQNQQQKYLPPPSSQSVDTHNIFPSQQPNRLNQQQQTVDTHSTFQNQQPMYFGQQNGYMNHSNQYSVPSLNQNQYVSQSIPSQHQLNSNEFTASKMDNQEIRVTIEKRRDLPHAKRTTNDIYKQNLQRIPLDPKVDCAPQYVQTLDKFFNDVPKDQCFALCYHYFMTQKSQKDSTDVQEMFNTIVNDCVTRKTLKFDPSLMQATNDATRAWDIMARVNSDLRCVYKVADPSGVFLSHMYDTVELYKSKELDKETLRKFISRALFQVLYQDSIFQEGGWTTAETWRVYRESCINPVCKILSDLENEELEIIENVKTAIENLMYIFANINGLTLEKYTKGSQDRIKGEAKLQIDTLKTQISDDKPKIDPEHKIRYIQTLKDEAKRLGFGDTEGLWEQFKQYIELRNEYADNGLPILNDKFLLELIAISMDLEEEGSKESKSYAEYKQGAADMLRDQMKALNELLDGYGLGGKETSEQKYHALTERISKTINSQKWKKDLVQGYKHILEVKIPYESIILKLIQENNELRQQKTNLKRRLKTKDKAIHAMQKAIGKKIIK